ncbi:MAG: malate synthase [Caryophanon sp.]|nr:malate synthase [Caryophanon sp.]
MDLINKEVTHAKWGVGTIMAHEDTIVSIRFEGVDKKFVYPDAFEQHLAMKNDEDAAYFNSMMAAKEAVHQRKLEEQQEVRELAQKKEKLRLQYERLSTNHKLHAQSQLVFWCDEEEKTTVLRDWVLFSGAMKSGQNKGKPNKAVRLHQNSAVVVTARDAKQAEKERRILGVYMVKEGFIGKLADDGFVPAHATYRIRLTEEESAQLYFWHYYTNHKTPEKMAWSTGKYRYFDNEWTAQIVRDIYALKTDAAEKAEVKAFLEYFCKQNQLTLNDLAPRNGVLVKTN